MWGITLWPLVREVAGRTQVWWIVTVLSLDNVFNTVGTLCKSFRSSHHHLSSHSCLYVSPFVLFTHQPRPQIGVSYIKRFSGEKNHDCKMTVTIRTTSFVPQYQWNAHTVSLTTPRPPWVSKDQITLILADSLTLMPWKLAVLS